MSKFERTKNRFILWAWHTVEQFFAWNDVLLRLVETTILHDLSLYTIFGGSISTFSPISPVFVPFFQVMCQVFLELSLHFN